MGLDVIAYEIAEPIAIPDEDDPYEAGQTEAFVYVGFEQSARGYPILRVDEERGIAYGPWMQTSGRKQHFRAGSYSAYGQFRRALSMAVLGVTPEVVWESPDEYRERPFFELINFADNEGTIGREACADLARDFQEHREAVLSQWGGSDPTDEWYRRKYQDWQAAFEFASECGIVDLG